MRFHCLYVPRSGAHAHERSRVLTRSRRAVGMRVKTARMRIRRARNALTHLEPLLAAA